MMDTIDTESHNCDWAFTQDDSDANVVVELKHNRTTVILPGFVNTSTYPTAICKSHDDNLIVTSDIADWYKKHPEMDIGLHLTLTSEWKNYRWGPVSNPSSVPELIDPEGYLWRGVIDVASRTPVATIEKEVRAQIERAYERGIKPSHIDTHMGTLYSKVEYTEAFFNIAMEYGIPANVIEFTPSRVQKFRKQGYPITARLIESGRKYTLPKLDDFSSVPDGKDYQNKKENFFDLIQNLEPGITEIIFHPSIYTEGLKKITNSWQQRVWEAKMFSDPEVIQFLKNEGIIFTNWKEMMVRFKERITK